ncbi:COX15/CtaA family protein [Haloferacaceae archaeon DSL9]
MTLSLITLGVYTAATGSGLACEAQWPLCSDQLIPALTINPDFIEWFHRVVAMITGFFILGTAGWAWRSGETRTRLASTLAVVLLPLQISIGAVTVTIGGLVPGGYSPPTHAAHLLVALAIFGLLTLTTLYAYAGAHTRSLRERTRRMLFVAGGALAVSALFSRAVPLLQYGSSAQAWYYATSLVVFAALLAVVVWQNQAGNRLLQAVSGLAFVGFFVTMLLGRDIVIYTGSIRALNAGLLVGVFALVGVALWLTADRGGGARRSSSATRSD